jgi:hypothetical protein
MRLRGKISEGQVSTFKKGLQIGGIELGVGYWVLGFSDSRSAIYVLAKT